MAPSASFVETPLIETSPTCPRNWLSKRHYQSSDFSLEQLAETVRIYDLKVTVIVPAKQVADTVAGVLNITISPLVRAGIVSSVVAIVTASPDDKTATVVAANGTRVVYREDVAPEMGPSQGKGDALWRALQATDGDIVAFLDGDTGDPSPEHLIGILGPLIMYPEVKMVRGTFDRPFKKEGCATMPHEGGRVTELTARPLLNVHWPALAGFSQPLAGEFAARRTLLEKLPFPVGYGVEIATLIDTFELEGLDAIAQVALGTRQNAHKSLRDLTMMSYAILYAVEKRIGRQGRVTDKMFIPWKGDFVSVPTSERPPISMYKKLVPESERALYLGPPFITVPGVDNFRDAGGQAVSPCTSVRKCVIFRSAAFSSLTPEGKTRLDALGIRRVFDLRSMVELTDHKKIHGGLASTLDHASECLDACGEEWKRWEKQYHSWADDGSGPLRVHVPTFKDTDFSASATAVRLRDYADDSPEGFARVYMTLLSQLGPGMKVILTHIAEHPGAPFVVHCTAGKDRTGVVIMLLLLLAGCDADAIAHDYALTEVGLANWRPGTVKRLMEGNNEFLQGNRKASENVTSARESTMYATIDAFFREWNSVDTWAQCIAGVDDEVLQRARNNLLLYV